MTLAVDQDSADVALLPPPWFASCPIGDQVQRGPQVAVPLGTPSEPLKVVKVP